MSSFTADGPLGSLYRLSSSASAVVEYRCYLLRLLRNSKITSADSLALVSLVPS
jgi:hypothetical protein